MTYQIGLDFGTKQTKVCIYDAENNIPKYFEFEQGDLFLLSQVSLLKNGCFAYGDINSNKNIIRTYNYFKMAAADDENYKFQTKGREEKFIGINYVDKFLIEEKLFSAEFISTIYLAFVILKVTNYLENQIDKNANTSGFLRQFSKKKNIEIDLKITIQMGIPTEWSNEINRYRKRKFESILFLAWMLKEKYSTLENYIKATKDILIHCVRNLISEYSISEELFNNKLNDIGLSVFPESAAGLYYLKRNHNLEREGLYATMDIGAGTTDVSFFKVMSDGRFGYYASESFTVAANSVYQDYMIRSKGNKLKSQDNSLSKLNYYENLVRDIMNDEKLGCKVIYSSTNVFYLLQSLLRRLYARRVRNKFQNNLVDLWQRRPILMYGGGTLIDGLHGGDIEFFNPTGPFTKYYLEMTEIIKYLPGGNIQPDRAIWEPVFPLLVVALGLSYPKLPTEANWLEDSFYNMGTTLEYGWKPHPFNEDCYLYDVINS